MTAMHLPVGALLKNGGYRIEKVLGRGGFGITYLAEQTGLGRKVALKEFFMQEHCNRDSNTSYVSVPSVGSRNLVERFRQKFLKEARLIASFDNNNIIRIYDVFEDNGTAYYVMEYLEGKSLKALVEDNGPLSQDVALKYIRHIADALSEVHSNNLLHLDVKPANIMLNRKGEAVLIDFGISKHYDEGGVQTSSALTGTSEGYAPLEQYEAGALDSFTPATDIYALGATLFTLIAGARPPKASDVMNYGLPEFPRGTSPALRAAVTAAMQPAVRLRPKSIEDFLSLLSEKANVEMEGVISVKEQRVAKKEQGEEGEVTRTGLDISRSSGPEETVLPVVNAIQEVQEGGRPARPKKKNAIVGTMLFLFLLTGAVILLLLHDGGNEGTIVSEAPVESDVVHISVYTTPVGASVYVDDRYLGSTPVIDMDISRGEHTIRITKDGYTDIEEDINAGADSFTMDMVLSPVSEAEHFVSDKEMAAAVQASFVPECVDLGLSVKWATCNVGTSTPGDYGNYYAWGETATKSSYTEENSTTYGKQMSSIAGNPTYDVARKDWGDGWRIPTLAEFQELIDNCIWVWTNQGGINGCKVTSKKNGKSIFLPAAGICYDSVRNEDCYGDYWCATPFSVEYADCIEFGKDGPVIACGPRYAGMSVRPVCD